MLQMEKLRQQINHLDDELMQILGQRMKVADEIGKYKKANNITILQTNRWNAILRKSDFERREAWFKQRIHYKIF